MSNASENSRYIRELEEVFSYDPLTGYVVRRKTGKKIGGMVSKKARYLVVWHKKKRIRVHRLAWAFTYGAFPIWPAVIDHINDDRQDNRISNLRVVLHKMNLMISGLSKNNKTGFRGVSFCKQTDSYKASIVVNGRQQWLGRHETVELAAEARETAERQLGIIRK